MTDALQQHLNERTDPIERLRAHLEKHKHHQQAFFATAGLSALLERLKTTETKVDALQAQVERLLGKEGKRIGEALVHNHELRREQGGD